MLIAVMIGGAWPPQGPAQAADAYGAIAYSQSTRRYGYAWGKPTQADAEDAALRECGASDAFVAVWGRNCWIALAHGRGTSYGWAWREESEQAARNAAVSECAQRASGCHVLVSLYTGGQGTATIIVDVPANTRVFIGDVEVPLRSGTARFDSPTILGGKRYHYTFTARMNIDGEAIEETVRSEVFAFHTTHVTFPDLAELSELGARPRAPSAVTIVPDRFAP